jgi:hypothetical protein
LLACLPLAACYSTGDTRVFVTSTPPGADIALDGEPTGQTTPAILELGTLWPGDHELILSKDGFEAEKRKLLHHKLLYTSRWGDGANDVAQIPLPLWWTFGDLLTPVGVHWIFEPHELHVKLYRIGEFAEIPKAATEAEVQASPLLPAKNR